MYLNIKHLSLFCLIILFFIPKLSAEGDSLKESADASLKWLKFIDQEQYDQSWDAASATFKVTIPKNNWGSIMMKVRQPLGKVTTRRVLDQRVATDPEGLPKGDYMVMFYDTSFTKKGVGHELVTLMKESDGSWRVLTYQFQ